MEAHVVAKALTVIVPIVMLFSVPLTALLTSHFRKQSKWKHQIAKEQVKLEEIKHQNYLLETEKMKLEMHKLETELSKDEPGRY